MEQRREGKRKRGKKGRGKKFGFVRYSSRGFM